MKEAIEVEHLNGLVSGNGFSDINQVYIINPTTRNFYKLTSPPVRTIHVKASHIFYFFGFDELRNEHKVLNIRMLYNQSRWPFTLDSIEFMMFTLSNYSWRKIDVKLPIER